MTKDSDSGARRFPAYLFSNANRQTPVGENVVQKSSCENRCIAVLVAAVSLIGSSGVCRGSDHLDSPAVIADPSADIGDLYAWTAPDGRHLNLVMTLVGHSFSDKLGYVFHIDSGTRFGRTTATTLVTCRFGTASNVDCRAGSVDRAVGDASKTEGLAGHNHRFRVFAGLRDDPFFNNVKGSRDAFQAAAAALRNGAATDAAGCPKFDAATVQAIHDRWRHTDGGPPQNYLAGWTSSAIVVSIDLGLVNRGGKLLAVWATTANAKRQVDRAGRPLTANALLAPLGPAALSDQLKDDYNRATPATSDRFRPEIQNGLALYDGYDGNCGNQWMALGDPDDDPDVRYLPLAMLLTDDRLWVNSAAVICKHFLAVERAGLDKHSALANDCGGRTPDENAANLFRSLLVNGAPSGIDDGLERDEHVHSASVFPFLAAPDDAENPAR